MAYHTARFGQTFVTHSDIEIFRRNVIKAVGFTNLLVGHFAVVDIQTVQEMRVRLEPRGWGRSRISGCGS